MDSKNNFLVVLLGVISIICLVVTIFLLDQNSKLRQEVITTSIQKIKVIPSITINPSRVPSPSPSNTPSVTPKAVSVLTVYFNNTNLNPNARDCAAVYPVKREVPKTSTPLNNSLKLLFAGPNEEERQQGYVSLFSDETKNIMKSVSLKGGVVYIDFQKPDFLKAVEAGANSSCGSAQFWAAVERTALSVTGVKTVLEKNFSLDGSKSAFQDLMQ